MLPIAVGSIADSFGLGASFIVPMMAYLFIAIFAVAAREASRGRLSTEPPAAASPIP